MRPTRLAQWRPSVGGRIVSAAAILYRSVLNYQAAEGCSRYFPIVIAWSKVRGGRPVILFEAGASRLTLCLAFDCSLTVAAGADPSPTAIKLPSGNHAQSPTSIAVQRVLAWDKSSGDPGEFVAPRPARSGLSQEVR